MFVQGRQLACLFVEVTPASFVLALAFGVGDAAPLGGSRYTGGAEKIPSTFHAAYYDIGG